MSTSLSYASLHADRVRLTPGNPAMADRLPLTLEERGMLGDGIKGFPPVAAHNYLHLTEPACRDMVSLVLSWLAEKPTGLERALDHLNRDTYAALVLAVQNAEARDEAMSAAADDMQGDGPHR